MRSIVCSVLLCAFGLDMIQAQCVIGLDPLKKVTQDSPVLFEELQLDDTCKAKELFDWSQLMGVLKVEKIGPSEYCLTGQVAMPDPGDTIYHSVDVLQWTIIEGPEQVVVSGPKTLRKAIKKKKYIHRAHCQLEQLKGNARSTSPDIELLTDKEWYVLRDLSFALMFCAVNGDAGARPALEEMRRSFPAIGFGELSEIHRGNELIATRFSRSKP